MFLGSLYCNNIDPDLTTLPRGSSLTRVHSVCFHYKIESEVIWSKKQTFSGQKYWLDKAKFFLVVDLQDFLYQI